MFLKVEFCEVKRVVLVLYRLSSTAGPKAATKQQSYEDYLKQAKSLFTSPVTTQM